MTRLQAALTSRMLRSRGGLARALAAIVVFGAYTAACDVHGISGPGDLTSLKVTPSTQTLLINATQQFVATGADFEGVAVAISPVWSVVSGGGSISTSGVFTAGTVPGTYTSTVMATSNGRTATATVTVLVGPLASITVTPSPVTLATGGTQQYVAVGRDASGNVVSFTPTWSVIANGGSINSSGVFTAGTVAGTFTNTVQASSNGLAATATVTVLPGALASLTVTPNPATLAVTQTQQFTATGRDANGNAIAVTPTWAVVAGGGAINASGLFTGGGVPGTYTNTIQATSGTLTATATVILTAGPLAFINVIPNPATLLAGSTQQFAAVGTDASGNVVGMTPVWSVINGGGTINSSTGVFTAGAAAGTFSNTVRATSGAISNTATVIVTVPIPPPVVATITVTPNPATLLPGQTQQFAAVGRDAAGNVVGISPSWAVGQGGGTITQTGLFTAGPTAGTFTNTVIASASGASGTATVTVLPAPPVLTTITVTPNPAVLQAGQTQQFAAVGRDANGNVMAISPTWSAASGGTITNTGLFTAGAVTGTFVNAVTATANGVSGSATVTVVAALPVLATITVTPNPVTLNSGQTQQFVAVGRDGNGNIMAISPVWSVVAGGGIINSNGLFTAGAIGGTFNNTVSASANGKTGTATVTVVAAGPAPFIDLGQAAANGIMAGTAVSCTGSPSTINANVSVSPGFTISGPCIITGVLHLNDGVAVADQIALTSAYTVAAGKPCVNNVTALGGTTKLAGTYCGAALDLTGVITLDGGGDPNATFLFQSGSSLIVAGNVLLINGAQAKNVFWQVGSSATLGTGSQFQGNILALTSITLVTGTTLNGRALARNGAVSAGTGSVITLP